MQMNEWLGRQVGTSGRIVIGRGGEVNRTAEQLKEHHQEHHYKISASISSVLFAQPIEKSSRLYAPRWEMLT